MKNKLKELRKINKKTQLDIAKILNITVVGYNGYETGKRTPAIQTLCKLADYYGVSLDYLVGREFFNEFSVISEDEKELLNIYKKLNDKNKIRILSEAQGMFISQD